MGKTAGYIGMDVGSSGCKAAILDISGNILAVKRREYGFEYPAKGRVELNPGIVWNCVKEVLSEIAQVKCECEIRMISVSSIGEALVMVDECDRILCNGIMYLDERGADTIQQVDGKFGIHRIHRITGLPPRMFYSLNRILWMQKHEPEILNKTRHYFMFEDYITFMLTGERLVDASSASKTWMFDVKNLQWSEDIGMTFGIPLDRFSKVVKTGTHAGKIRPQIAWETGLPDSLKVVVGCHDQCGAALGSGCTESGEVAAGEGSTESLNLVVDQENITEEFFNLDVCLEPYVIPGKFMVPVGQHTHGTSLRWFADQFAGDLKALQTSEKSVYDMLNEQCAGDAGELFFLPYLTRANLMDAENRSLGAFLGLETGSERSILYRALLEGLSFETCYCFDILQSSHLPVRKITAAGGCSKSDVLMQIKADVLGCEISILKNRDAGIASLAMICAVADRVYSNYVEAAEKFVQTTKQYLPEKSKNEFYSEKYRKYKIIRETMKRLYNEI